MKVNAKGERMKLAEEALHIKTGFPQHPIGDIYDPGRYPMLFQVTGDADKANGIHLKDGCRGDDITYRSVDYRPSPEVVIAWGMY